MTDISEEAVAELTAWLRPLTMIGAKEAADLIEALHRERNQWRGMVGHICATIPIGETIRATGTLADLCAYFTDLHARESALRARVTELEASLSKAETDLESARAMRIKLLNEKLSGKWREELDEVGRLYLEKIEAALVAEIASAERRAAEARGAERERCAKIVDAASGTWPDPSAPKTTRVRWNFSALSAAIRAGGEG